MSTHTARIALAALIVSAAPCVRPPAFAQATTPIAVRLVPDEAEAAVAILRLRLAGSPVPPAAWERLFASEPYRRLAQRERDFQRPFTDSAFRAFLESDTLLARASDLITAVDVRRRTDVAKAAERAFAYLPPGAHIRARLYPMIKPRTNSFVYELETNPAMFLYVDPAQSAEQFENQLAHELHHVGFAGSCATPADASLSAPARALLERMGGFGEGIAMLAAAGGPDVHPHATSDSATRARWDTDVASFAADRERLERFFLDVLDGRMVQTDSIRATAMNFYGVQGPWYTVGWRMAATIEQRFGRARLVDVICDPRRFIAAYNEAAGPAGPRWSPRVVSLR